MEETNNNERKNDCCGGKRGFDHVNIMLLVSFLLILYGVSIAYQEKKDVSWQCVEWDGIGQTYYQNECRFYKKNNSTCTWRIDEDSNSDIIWQIENATMVNATHIPCTKFIYVKRPLGAINRIKSG